MSTLDPHAPTRTDRIALSNELFELAEAFIEEARAWNFPDAKIALSRSTNTLAPLARHVLSADTDFAKATAYAEAARLILDNVRACRRFFTAVFTEPTRGPKR